jgi:hypothetical protein
LSVYYDRSRFEKGGSSPSLIKQEIIFKKNWVSGLKRVVPSVEISGSQKISSHPKFKNILLLNFI